jgi:hypothetical protein
MDVEQLKEDVLRGQITLDRLIEVVVTSQRELQAAKQGLDQTKQELDQAKRRIAELEQQLGGAPRQEVSEPFSLRAEEQRQQARGKKRRQRTRRSRGGRRATAEKIAQAVRTEKVLPVGVPEATCRLSHAWPVWRLENGQAVLVAYEIYRGPDSHYGKIPGVSEKVRVVFFGVHKDAQTLQQILDPATFAGIVISDDAAVYANFTQSQKCWAHFLRKATQLTLMEPANVEYDRLLEIYREACRVQRDRRLSAEGRKSKVAPLDDEILDRCASVWAAELPPSERLEDDYRRLCNEVMRVSTPPRATTFDSLKPSFRTC